MTILQLKVYALWLNRILTTMSWEIFIVKKEYCKYRYEDLHG